MIQGFWNIAVNRTNTVLTLGFAYGSTILFTFFGPAMMRNGQSPTLLALLAVFCHVLAFFLPPYKPMEGRPSYFLIMYAGLLPLILFFPFFPIELQAVTAGGYAWMVGRVGSFWTRKVYATIAVDFRGRTICCALFVSFSLLYVMNVVQPMVKAAFLMAAPCAASGLSVLFFKRIKPERPLQVDPAASEKGHPLLLCVFLLIVYIAGGYSYAGIYPSFLPYAHVDRFYNVLFFLVGLAGAGLVLDFWGRKIAFSLGVALLGISFTFYVMPSTVLTYFFSQTFLQAGWAFVNAFGWSFSWDMADRYKNVSIFSLGICAMLFGAALGGGLAEVSIFFHWDHKSIQGLCTFVPLFISIACLSWFPETLKQEKPPKKVRVSDLENLPLVKALTPREKEVLCLMMVSMSNCEMSRTLFISQSTVKTHVSRIYAKLGIASKRTELQGLIFNSLKINDK
ncbi:MAG: helix-turn-helix transcriptional regulator [Desulfobacterales bacterium]|nr:helix-turn-helix transcriptional regulator [Desulfobacterales bacterium]